MLSHAALAVTTSPQPFAANATSPQPCDHEECYVNLNASDWDHRCFKPLCQDCRECGRVWGKHAQQDAASSIGGEPGAAHDGNTCEL